MAGQVVPLAGFEDGDYRLDVQVTDLLSGKSVSRDVHVHGRVVEPGTP